MLAYQYHERLKYLPVLIGNFLGSESVGGPSGKKKKRTSILFSKIDLIKYILKSLLFIKGYTL